MTNATMTDTAEAIQLDVPYNPRGQVDTRTQITWCISRELMKEVLDSNTKDPYLLLVVTAGLREISRDLVPLLAYKTHLTFYYPGINTVHAAVVWRGKYADRSVSAAIMSKEKRVYKTPVTITTDGLLDDLRDRLSHLTGGREVRQRELAVEIAIRDHSVVQQEPLPDDTPEADVQRRALETQIAVLERELELLDGEPEEADEVLIAQLESDITSLSAEIDRLESEIAEWESNPVQEIMLARSFGSHVYRCSQVSQLDVTVPTTMFSKTHEWTKRLAAKYTWPMPPRNGCQVRKRASFTAVTLLPVMLYAMLVEILDLGIVAVLLFAGMRKIDFSVLRHPVQQKPRQIYGTLKPSYWFSRPDPERKTWNGYMLRQPPFWFLNLPVWTVFTGLGLLGWLLIGPVFFLILGLTMAFFLAVFAAIGMALTRGPLAKRWAVHQEKSQRKREAWHQQERESFARELTELACDVNRPTGWLPKRRRATYLLHAAEYAVCKPLPGQ